MRFLLILSLFVSLASHPEQFAGPAGVSLVADSEFVLGPGAADFSVRAFLDEQASPLLEHAATIETWCWYASVNPRVVLTLLEMDGGQVSRGWQGGDAAEELPRLIVRLAQEFYRHLYSQGARSPLAAAAGPASGPATTGSGTAAVKALLAEARSEPCAAPAADADAWLATWGRLFPGTDPRQEGAPITPATPPPAGLLQFPFPVGQRWQFNGPHNWNGSGLYWGRPFSSIDFFTGAGSCGAPPGDIWASAAAKGRLYHPSSAPCWLRIDHGNGWVTSYYHLRNTAANGSVDRNARLGTIGCEVCVGGSATGPHVHFSLLYNGAYFDLDGVQLSGWTVRPGTGAYSSGHLEWGATRLAAYSAVTNDAPPPWTVVQRSTLPMILQD